MKKRKRETTEGIELPNQEIIRTLGEKENYEYLRILEKDAIKKAQANRNEIKCKKKVCN